MIVAVDGVRRAHSARHIAWENFPVLMYYLTYRKEKGDIFGHNKAGTRESPGFILCLAVCLMVSFCRFCCYGHCLRACRNGGAPPP